jgi:hypothetical protein
MRGDAQDVHPAVADLQHEEDVQALQADRVNVEKSQASSPEAWARRNTRHEVSTARGAGPIRSLRKIR